MGNLLGSLVIACSMYSRIPMPQVEWTRERMKYAMCFFPLVGIITGGLSWCSLVLLNKAGFPVFAVLAAAVIPLLITGGIHMDGFLDVVDARASHAGREKRLEILKDPHIGAFAVIGGIVYMVLYIGALAELRFPMAAAYAGCFVVSRALSGLAVVTFPLAKGTGLAAAFAGQADKKKAAWTMAVWLVLSLAVIRHTGGNAAACVTALTAGLVFLYYYRMTKQEFGGITGDLAGYFLQLCELLTLIGLAFLSHI